MIPKECEKCIHCRVCAYNMPKKKRHCDFYEESRPQGEWIFKHGSSDVWCSVCDISLESNLCEGIKFRFCPNCGAYMWKGEEE